MPFSYHKCQTGANQLSDSEWSDPRESLLPGRGLVMSPRRVCPSQPGSEPRLSRYTGLEGELRFGSLFALLGRHLREAVRLGSAQSAR